MAEQLAFAMDADGLQSLSEQCSGLALLAQPCFIQDPSPYVGVQGGSVASRPLALLKAQPGLWDHLAAAACMAGKAVAAPEPRRLQVEGEEEEEGLQGQADEGWRLRAQALATRILALSCNLPGAVLLCSCTIWPCLDLLWGCRSVCHSCVDGCLAAFSAGAPLNV